MVCMTDGRELRQVTVFHIHDLHLAKCYLLVLLLGGIKKHTNNLHFEGH